MIPAAQRGHPPVSLGRAKNWFCFLPPGSPTRTGGAWSLPRRWPAPWSAGRQRQYRYRRSSPARGEDCRRYCTCLTPGRVRMNSQKPSAIGIASPIRTPPGGSLQAARFSLALASFFAPTPLIFRRSLFSPSSISFRSASVEVMPPSRQSSEAVLRPEARESSSPAGPPRAPATRGDRKLGNPAGLEVFLDTLNGRFTDAIDRSQRIVFDEGDNILRQLFKNAGNLAEGDYAEGVFIQQGENVGSGLKEFRNFQILSWSPQQGSRGTNTGRRGGWIARSCVESPRLYHYSPPYEFPFHRDGHHPAGDSWLQQSAADALGSRTGTFAGFTAGTLKRTPGGGGGYHRRNRAGAGPPGHPKKADPKKPDVYEVPELVINRRGWAEPAATAPRDP